MAVSNYTSIDNHIFFSRGLAESLQNDNILSTLIRKVHKHFRLQTINNGISMHGSNNYVDSLTTNKKATKA